MSSPGSPAPSTDANMMLTDLSAHPYFPLDLHLPDFVPMEVDFDYILGVFFMAVVFVFVGMWLLSGGAPMQAAALPCLQPRYLQPPGCSAQPLPGTVQQADTGAQHTPALCRRRRRRRRALQAPDAHGAAAGLLAHGDGADPHGDRGLGGGQGRLLRRQLWQLPVRHMCGGGGCDGRRQQHGGQWAASSRGLPGPRLRPRPAGKEYAKADSRYASRDSFIVSMEAITAFLWGPLCPLLVHAIFTAKPWRYSLMIVVSAGQIYGDVLYYGTCYLEGALGAVGGGGMHTCGVGAADLTAPLPAKSRPTPPGFVHSRPEPLYFWVYFVFMNAIWIVVPFLCIIHAWRKVSAAVGAASGGARGGRGAKSKRS